VACTSSFHPLSYLSDFRQACRYTQPQTQIQISLSVPHTIFEIIMASLLLSLNNIPAKPTLSPLSQGLLPRYYNLKKSENLLLPRKPFTPKCLSSVSSSLSPLSLDDQPGEAPVFEEEDDHQQPLSQVWKEIQGCNNWEGLLDPMNSHLRREIIRYGEFAQASYDSFDFDPHSKYCGTCKYQGAHFFEKLDMADRGYNISRYLYATSNINLPNFFQKSKISSVWSRHANWMGYIAVTTDEEEIKRLGRRDIVVAWRGTVTYLEWISDLKDILHPANFGNDPSIKIESGFYDLYTEKENNCKYCSFSAREQVLAEIKRLLDYYRGEEISLTFTGHSLGAALAILSAYDIAEMRLNVVRDAGDGDYAPKIPITVYSFSGPRVGNLRFKERCDELGVKVQLNHSRKSLQTHKFNLFNFFFFFSRVITIFL
jgi:hypothetical protein